MDYHDALLRHIRALRFAQKPLQIRLSLDDHENRQHLIMLTSHAAGMALARLGGLGTAW
jgi:hypothetical protein